MKKVISVLTAALLMSGIALGSTSGNVEIVKKEAITCPLKGTPNCPLIHKKATAKKESAKAGTTTCPLKGTPECPLAQRSCCKK